MPLRPDAFKDLGPVEIDPDDEFTFNSDGDDFSKDCEPLDEPGALTYKRFSKGPPTDISGAASHFGNVPERSGSDEEVVMEVRPGFEGTRHPQTFNEAVPASKDLERGAGSNGVVVVGAGENKQDGEGMSKYARAALEEFCERSYH